MNNEDELLYNLLTELTSKLFALKPEELDMEFEELERWYNKCKIFGNIVIEYMYYIGEECELIEYEFEEIALLFPNGIKNKQLDILLSPYSSNTNRLVLYPNLEVENIDSLASIIFKF